MKKNAYLIIRINNYLGFKKIYHGMAKREIFIIYHRRLYFLIYKKALISKLKNQNSVK